MFTADELPRNRIITSSEDPRMIGMTIEDFDFKWESDQRRKAAVERVMQETEAEMEKNFPESRKDHDLE